MNAPRQSASKLDEFPLISCVMPTYGRPGLVGEAVTMFLEQDYPNKELIVLNDCAGQFYFSELPGVRVYNSSVRYPTLGDKRNASIDLARGEYIAIWDDDDVYLPWRLSYSLQQVREHDTPFYRPEEFLAYWGNEPLHDNRSIPGWVNHSTVLFHKNLWRTVGGYPAKDLGEDAAFFEAIHRHLGHDFLCYAIAREDRFMILRGQSPYQHMSMEGGDKPRDTTPGMHVLEPTPLADPILRTSAIRQVAVHDVHINRATSVQSADVKEPRLATTDFVTDWAGVPILSVCISLKNRSRVVHEDKVLELFPNCVRSLKEASQTVGLIELVVTDFGSSDWPLHEWLSYEITPTLRIQIVSIDEPFSRGRGLNLAAQHANSERLFLCDADIFIDAGALRRGLAALEKGQYSVPICRYLEPDGRPGFWQDFGAGLVFVLRKTFAQIGGVPEFQSWGGEDDLMRNRLRQALPELRERDAGLAHQWHPEEVRHEHYARKRKSDYEHFLRASAVAHPPEKVLHEFVGEHPHWTGSANLVQLFDNGRMCRVGVDRGRYEYEPGVRVVLRWDNWPTETLLWNDRTQAYEDPTKAFSLRGLSTPLRAIRDQFGELSQRLKELAPFQFLNTPGNWGDAIIRSGTLSYFRHLQVEFVEIANPQSADPTWPAVLGGSGGFCRFWQLAPALLGGLLERCPTIVILPSTYERQSLGRLSGLDKVVFFAREQLSMKELCKGYHVQFAPDMAFWNSVPHFPPPSQKQLHAFRTDRESLGFYQRMSNNKDVSLLHDSSGDWQRFFAVLARYEHIHTDRTHVAIAAAMLGRKVTFYPNAYHKNQGIFESSLHHFDVTWKAECESELEE